jgi:hypothetical protein
VIVILSLSFFPKGIFICCPQEAPCRRAHSFPPSHHQRANFDAAGIKNQYYQVPHMRPKAHIQASRLQYACKSIENTEHTYEHVCCKLDENARQSNRHSNFCPQERACPRAFDRQKDFTMEEKIILLSVHIYKHFGCWELILLTGKAPSTGRLPPTPRQSSPFRDLPMALHHADMRRQRGIRYLIVLHSLG